ncbi:MAG: GNAT family N-acetyltransferase [Balneolaceae bacterium]
MKQNLLIRFAEEADIPEIIELCQQHAEFERAEYNETGKQEKLKKHLFSSPSGLKCLIAEVEGNIAGYACYIKQFSTWDADFYIYMDCLFLNDNYRGYGTGEKMMDRIKEETRKLGCSLIQWQTPDFNNRAMKFYRKIGAYSKSKERFFLEV